MIVRFSTAAIVKIGVAAGLGLVVIFAAVSGAVTQPTNTTEETAAAFATSEPGATTTTRAEPTSTTSTTTTTTTTTTFPVAATSTTLPLSPPESAAPAATAPDVEPEEPQPDCHPSYEGACLPLDADDVDCLGGGGDGPEYVQGPVQVLGTDVYELDTDLDGIACNTG